MFGGFFLGLTLFFHPAQRVSTRCGWPQAQLLQQCSHIK